MDTEQLRFWGNLFVINYTSVTISYRSIRIYYYKYDLHSTGEGLETPTLYTTVDQGTETM